MLKDLVLNPWAYKSQSSKIGPIEGQKNMFKNMFKKSSKIRKNVQGGLATLLEHSVDKFVKIFFEHIFPPILHSSAFLILDRYCHQTTKIYIL